MTGQELKDMRTALGLTAKQAAEQIGVGIRTWFRYEAGKYLHPSREKAFRMANEKRLKNLKKTEQ